jgi:protein-glutamine gamma-glutamyltransferase
MQRYFQISVHALIITAFFALAFTGRLDVASIVVFTVGVSWSLYRTIQNSSPPLTARGAFILSCIYTVAFFIDALRISGSFIPATIHLVLFLELVKLFQEKTDKDYFYLIVLAFLKILAASSLTIDLSFVVTLVLFLIALVSTLMSFDMYRSERKSSAGSKDVTAPLSGMSAWATLWILVVAVVLFFMIPRVGTGYFSRATTPSLLLSGFTESVELGQIGQVKLSSAVVMRVKLVSGPPYAVLKWRGISLDGFDGTSWFKTDRRRSSVPPSSRGQYTIRPIENARQLVRYQVLLEPLATTALFGPLRIRAIRGSLPALETDNDDGVYTRFPLLRRVQYEVISEISPPPRPQKTQDVPPIPNEIQRKYLRLPADTDPRVRALANEITANAATDFDKAAFVEAYLKKNYSYTLELTWQPGRQPISTFLFSAKTGHCEYFASSMAILLRAAGVPTRLVNGFLMGDYNPVGDDYIVRQSDAHSWVEVYVDGKWVEFDPTPPDSTEHPSGLLAQISHYVDAAELYWNSYVLTYDASLQMQLFRSAQDKAQSLQADLRTKSDEWMILGQEFSDRFADDFKKLAAKPWFWLIVLASTLSVLGIRYHQFVRTEFHIWRARNGGGAVTEDVVEEMFRRAARLADPEGKSRQPAETWREWMIGVSDPTRRSLVHRALSIYEKSKYGRLPVSASDFTVLEETIRELKA